MKESTKKFAEQQCALNRARIERESRGDYGQPLQITAVGSTKKTKANFKIWFKGNGIEYDSDYGIDHRSGWSVIWDGSYIVQLEKHLIVALWKAWKAIINGLMHS